MSLSNRKGFIWINGKFIEWKNAQIHCLTHTLHYGFGVLEGIRAYETENGTAIFRLKDHTDRLFRSAEILNLPIFHTREEINNAHKEIIRKNNLSSGYIRSMIFSTADNLSLHTDHLFSNIMIAAWKLGTYLGENALSKGIKVYTSSLRRSNHNKIYKAKANGNYLHSIVALQEAKAHNCDEALFLDHKGYIAEGSGENIFIVNNNILYTPKLHSILEGITRDTLFTIANNLGLSVLEKDISLNEVYEADEAFFTGTAAEITPICELDGNRIGSGQRGKITQLLQEAYLNQVTGKNNQQHQNWLTFV